MTQATAPITVHPVYNGLTQEAGRRRTGRIKFIDIVPPIEQEITDEKSVQKTFERFPLLPYSGGSKATSHRLVSLLYSMRNWSPTFSSVLKIKKAYAIGNKLEIGRQRDLTFNLGDDVEISMNEKTKFVQSLNENFIFKTGNRIGSLLDMSYCASDCYDAVGGIGIYVVTTQVLGITKITVQYEHPTDYIIFKNAEWGTEMALSRCWEDTYLEKYPPNIVPVYPLERVDSDGSQHTFFYIKNGGYFYGRPTDMGALIDKYNEYKIKQYISKKCKKAFVPDLILEYEDGPINGGLLDDEKARLHGYANAGDRINDRLTNEGDDPQGVYVTTRPMGARPMSSIEVNGLKNAKDINEFLREAEETILQCNNIPELLYKLSGTTGFSNQIFMDVFQIYNATFNNERQIMLETLFNQIINYGFSKLNIENMTGIQYKSPIQTMLDEHNNSKRSTETQSGSEKLKEPSEAGL